MASIDLQPPAEELGGELQGSGRRTGAPPCLGTGTRGCRSVQTQWLIWQNNYGRSGRCYIFQGLEVKMSDIYIYYRYGVIIVDRIDMNRSMVEGVYKIL